MSPAVSRAPLEAEDSPAVAEANAAIDMALAMIGANIDGARELAANYGEAAAAVFDARLRARRATGSGTVRWVSDNHRLSIR